MDNDRLTRIREAERQSHIKAYTEATLFQPGSWLAKPVRAVMELLPEIALKTIFAGWMWEKFTVRDQCYDIPRDRLVTLTTKVVTVVARKRVVV